MSEIDQVVFFTDPHCELRRRAHYTAASLSARDQLAHQIMQSFVNRGYYATFNLGDYFDTPHNTEAAISRAHEIISKTTRTLAGNHDVENREGEVSSMRLLSYLLPNKVVIDHANVWSSGSLSVYMVPHMLSQEAFLAQLEIVRRLAMNDETPVRFLLLHCNLTERANVDRLETLFLPADVRDDLLGVFHYILLGHEHAPADLCEGRVKVVGSLMPTGFSDFQAPCRALVFNLATRQFDDDLRITFPTFYGLASDANTDGYLDYAQYGYFRLIDDLPNGQAAKLVVDLYSAGALAVELLQKDSEEAALQVVEAPIQGAIEALSERINSGSPEHKALWEECLASIRKDP